ncbi:DNA-binding transcriptional regulator, AcrR family [Nakamurella panacisegetis]|uniref:DNA-binding transcriptional regulator, AcrR family n=1 Tax=Nakamurella panacisegetis TaxID=1090615 RepID=A0A1H0L3W4_9ACTN|nr:TetR/AcrR family transcriptional regulator [Nakamurella panacisegetis]SDO62752.1 DNA-binding transcriptional regulator, AcrR family [Nakamurella panacisegetis]
MAIDAAQPTPRVSVRERLLIAANELFYEEGVHSVGIDRVIERAGVAKASLYNTFGSKDELIKAYLESRNVARQRRITTKLAQLQTPRDKILGVFGALADLIAEPTFRGCAFQRATAEASGGPGVAEVVARSRGWVRDKFVELARDAGAGDPGALADRLVLLYDGATVAAQLDHQTDAAVTARDIASGLLDRELT